MVKMRQYSKGEWYEVVSHWGWMARELLETTNVLYYSYGELILLLQPSVRDGSIT